MGEEEVPLVSWIQKKQPFIRLVRKRRSIFTETVRSQRFDAQGCGHKLGVARNYLARGFGGGEHALLQMLATRPARCRAILACFSL